MEGGEKGSHIRCEAEEQVRYTKVVVLIDETEKEEEEEIGLNNKTCLVRHKDSRSAIRLV